MCRFSILILSAVFVAQMGCVTAKPKAYRDARGLPATSPSEVEVFWIPPDFPVQRIGEVSIRACPACGKSLIESKIRTAVAEIGGTVAIVASDATRTTGAVIVPGPTMSTAVATQKRDLTVIAGLRVDVPPQESPVPKAARSGVSFETEPPGAEVYVDGSFVGTTPIEEYPLEPGSHEIELRLEGHEPWARSLLVRKGAPVAIRASLTSSDRE